MYHPIKYFKTSLIVRGVTLEMTEMCNVICLFRLWQSHFTSEITEILNVMNYLLFIDINFPPLRNLQNVVMRIKEFILCGLILNLHSNFAWSKIITKQCTVQHFFFSVPQVLIQSCPNKTWLVNWHIVRSSFQNYI